MLQLDASILSRKAPIYCDGLLMPSLLPGFDLPLQVGLSADALT